MPKLFTCKRFAESHSRSFDSELPIIERCRYKFHHFLCLYCRRFGRQLKLIDEAAKICEFETESSDASSTLSNEAKERMKRALSEGKLADDLDD